MVYSAAGQLKLLVLKLLSEKPMSGYALMRAIREHTGFWQPSPGSMYPLLNSLERKGFLTSTSEGKRRVYSLTKEGGKLLRTLDRHKKSVMHHILKNLEVFESLVGKNEAELIRKTFKDIKSDSMPFREFYPEALELKVELFKMAQDKTPAKSVSKAKKVLRDAVLQLRKIRLSDRHGGESKK